MSYSNQVLYQNAAATRTHDAATTMLLPQQPPAAPAAAEAGCYVIECYWASLNAQCNVNGTKWN